jgi:hypothetical protein
MSRDKTASTANFYNTVRIAIRGLSASLRKIVPVHDLKEYRELMVYFHLFSTRHSTEASGLPHSSPLCPWDRPGGTP